jgi:hypothetical protein
MPHHDDKVSATSLLKELLLHDPQLLNTSLDTVPNIVRAYLRVTELGPLGVQVAFPGLCIYLSTVTHPLARSHRQVVMVGTVPRSFTPYPL